MSAWVLPLGGDGVCPDLLPAGGGERGEYEGPGVSTMGLKRAGLSRRYPGAGGVGVGSGAPDEPTATLRPPWRAACLLFWNLRKRFTIQKS